MESAFSAAGLPEVPRDELEAGTYTNAEIAESFRDDPLKLFAILVDISTVKSLAEKRSLLSFVVDAMKSA